MRKTLLCVFFLLLYLNNLNGQIPIDTNDRFIRIMEIGHFNDDAALDTLIGVATHNYNFKPKYIYWGSDTTSPIPNGLKKEKLILEYPDWIVFRVASNIDFLNNDTLMDIGFYIWGNYTNEEEINEETVRDTIINIALFGQRGLDTLETINLATIDTFQITPFIAMHLRFEHEFINPLYRDMTGTVSYEFNTIDLDIYDTSGVPPPIISEVEDYKKESVKIYPNPSIYYTNIELNGFEPGNYNIKIFNTQGKITKEFQIEVQKQGEIFQILDLNNMINGMYIILLEADGREYGPYQFILVN